jgi:hypothetical protein
VAPYPVNLSENAEVYYRTLLAEADACRASKSLTREPVSRLHRTRLALTQISAADSPKADRPLLDQLSVVLCASVDSTYVYYHRFEEPQLIYVLCICELSTTKAYPVLASMILTGRVQLLSALGINPPPLNQEFVFLIQ